MNFCAAIFMLYGIPLGNPPPLTDRGYRGYLRMGLANFPKRSVPVRVYFPGGATDPSRPEHTEAGYAFEVALDNPEFRPFPLSAIKEGLDAREALEHLARHLEYEKGDIEIIIFCAWTHQDHVRYLARKIFRNRRKVTIVGLRFPHNISLAGSLWRRLARIPRLALAMGAWHFTAIRNFEWWLRFRHMRKCAMYPNKLPPIS